MRGALLGYGKEEWMSRSIAEQRYTEKYFLYMGMMYMSAGLGWFIGMTFLLQEVASSDLMFGMLWIGLGLMYVFMYYHQVKINHNPVAVPGLYENGIQLPTHLFLPYPEIGKIERKPKRLNSWKKRDIVHLRSKFEKKPGSLTDGWIVSADFLGSGGMVELKTRMEIDRGLKAGRPDLVVYSSGGAKASERGMDPIKGAW
jgi:hypothetical protein